MLNCRFCSKTFKRKSQLKDHEQRHLNEKTQKCSCSLGFNTSQELGRHQRKTNHKPIPKVEDPVKKNGIECPICKSIFRTRSILKKHILCFHDKIKRFKCPFEGCDTAFGRKEHIKTHIMYLHSDDRSFKCDLCDKSFKQKRDLLFHNLTHSKVKNFKCDICFKAFAVVGNLIIHKQTHSDEKFKCSFKGCNREFSFKNSLKNHENYQHKGVERSHVCDVCGMGFINSTGLRSHQYTHSDVSTFKCELCPKSYKHRVSLIAHEKVHYTRVKVKCKKV